MSPTDTSNIEMLKVPGANLYYEVRGSGRVLLMMPGGPADAGAFRAIAGPLAEHYEVSAATARQFAVKLREVLEG